MRILVGAVFALIAAGLIVSAVVFFNARDVRDCAVTEKQQTVEVSGDGESTSSDVVYYIYTSDCGVLQLRQQPFLGVWSAAEMYGRLQVGSSYEIETLGPRIELLGWFPQIVRVA